MPPSLESWCDIICDIFVMARITFSVRLQDITFEEIWKNWKIGFNNYPRNAPFSKKNEKWFTLEKYITKDDCATVSMM